MRIDVSDFSGDYFQINYTTAIGRRVAIYGRQSINGSVEWLDLPAPFCDTGVAWTENILVPSSRWGDGYPIHPYPYDLLGSRSYG